MSKYEQLVDLFIKSRELGHYDPENFSICLYDVYFNDNYIKQLREKIEKITTKYKLQINPTLPEEDFANINILDIEL